MGTNWFIEELDIDYPRLETACKCGCRKIAGLDANDVDDVTQETAATILRVYAKNKQRFEDGQKLIAYSITVAKRAAYRHVRKKRRSQGAAAGIAIEQLGSAKSNDPFDEKLLRQLASCEQAAALLKTSEERVREVFLRMCRKLTNRSDKVTRKEIADALGISEATVRRVWILALERLRTELESSEHEEGSE